VTVLNVLYTVDINILHRVFSKYGTILKIVIFNKTGTFEGIFKAFLLYRKMLIRSLNTAGFQALIQFLDVASAVEAKLELDGQNIYSGCCTLRIQFSSLQDLKVKYNNEKSWDFTNPNLPTTPATDSTSHPSGVPMMDYNPYAPYGNTGMKSLMGGSMGGGMGGTPVLIASGIDTEVRSENGLRLLFGVNLFLLENNGRHAFHFVWSIRRRYSSQDPS
jgi:polypyrimidine tract-binding protein 2